MVGLAGDQALELGDGELDRSAEVGGDAPLRALQILEGEVRILGAVADDDQPWPPAHQLVQAEILEVAAVAQLEKPVVLVWPNGSTVLKPGQTWFGSQNGGRSRPKFGSQ